MQGIPPVNTTDDEDVAWGLQTAEALWKRGERTDALVWLRRAAQAAGDANDDDRALELARFAAELSDWLANPAPEPAPEAFPENEASTSPGVSFAVSSDAPQADDVDELVSVVDDADETIDVSDDFEDAEEIEEEEAVSGHEPSVLPAEQVHAGMFNPWAEDASQAEPLSRRETTPPVVAEPERHDTPVENLFRPEQEVITSVRDNPLAQAPEPERPAIPRPSESSGTPRPAPVAPPAPSRPKPPVPSSKTSLEPSSSSRMPVVPVAKASAPKLPPLPVSAPEIVAEPPAPIVAPALDLENVEAFADLPDDARVAFAAAAKLDDLSEGEEVQKFALAYVIEGTFDVAATMVDAPAARVETGAVLRARGSMGEGVPMRLICASPSGKLATWSDAHVDEAFRSIPWVEDDLRAAADKLQTLVGITVGPLGERIDASIRDEIVSRLTMRSYGPGELVVEAGAPIPGLLLIGVGELSLDGRGAVGSGEFLFPGEVLGAGAAPSTVRAGSLGALVLFGDRKLAQELLVTCPPLLEVFAGM